MQPSTFRPFPWKCDTTSVLLGEKPGVVGADLPDRLPVPELPITVSTAPFPPIAVFRKGGPQNRYLRDVEAKKWVHTTIITPEEAYDLVDKWTDAFTEPQRMAAVRRDAQMSPIEWWTRNQDRLVAKYGTDRHRLREAVYREFGKECTQFKISLAYAVISMFTPTGHRLRWIDMSAGWGDRLLAALSYADLDYYHAFDPNTDLIPGHQAIIAKYGGANADRVRIRYIPFETADLSGGAASSAAATAAAAQPPPTYNLGFFSPPFFDLERYSNAETQSVVQYPGFAQWRDKFLFPSLAKVWSVLEPGGHIVVHIADVSQHRICEEMVNYVRGFPGVIYRGVIASLAGAGKHRPMWVFMKRT